MVKLILIGAFSALLVNLLDLAELRNIPVGQRPNLQDPFYWLPYIINPLAGGFLVYVYIASNTALTPFLAVNIGASAPLLLRSISNTVPNFPRDPGNGT